jgi:aspartate aminotransferase
LFFLWFEGGFFMADEKEKGPIFDPAKPRETLFPLVRGEDQQKNFFDLRDPIKGLFGAIANVATSVSRSVNRQFSDTPVDAMDTLPDTPESNTILWSGKGAKAAKVYNARQKEAGTGKKFINCSLGQPDFLPADGLVDKAITYFKRKFTNFNYTPTQGIPEVIEAVQKFIQDKHFHKDKNCMDGQGVCITNGAKEALTFLFKAVGPGRTFIVTEPGWVSYKDEIDNAQGTMVAVQCGNDFKITPDQLRAALRKDPRAVFVLNNPSNPTGAVYSKKELEAIAEVLREFPLALVVEDSIYNRVTKEGARPPQLADIAPDLKGRIAQIFGAAKDGSLASERVAFCKAPLKWIKNVINLKSNLSGNTPVTTQAMVYAYVTSDNDKYLEECNKEYRKRFDEVQKCCRALGLTLDDAEGAFYAFPSLEGSPLKGATVTLSDGKTKMQINNGEDFVTWCFDLGIGLTPGGVFGKSANDNVRISCATSTPEIEEMCERITEHGRKAIMNDESGRTVGQYFEDCLKEGVKQVAAEVSR